MEAAQHAFFRGKRLVVLDERHRACMFFKIAKGERLEEIAAMVAEYPGLDDPYPFDISFDVIHRILLYDRTNILIFFVNL